MRALLIVLFIAGCAAFSPDQRGERQAGECNAEIERLSALLAAETAERQRLTRAGLRREETLRRQLEAMKAIERGILEREDRIRTETR